MTRSALTIAVLVLATRPGFAQSASAQAAGTDRWAPWVGCWDLVEEDARDGADAAVPADGRRSTQPPAATPRMCVARTGAAGATLTTSMRGQTVHELRLTPDGVEHPLTEAECRGTQRAEWSASGTRLFSSATLTCAGDTTARRVSGMSLLTSNGNWLDVQSVVVGAQESVRVRRYRRARDEAATVTRGAGGAFTLADIREAASKVSPATLEAALVEGTNGGFPLSSKDLIGLGEAGVPTSVIDVLVALSYPDRFVVDRGKREVAYGMPGGALYDPFFMGWAFGDPFLLDHMGYYSRVYGVYSPYYYGPFSYRTFGPTVIVSEGGGIGGGGGGGVPSQPTGTGRVVDGRGYTQVRPRETVPSDVAPTDRSGRSTSASTAPSSGGSSSSGGSVSPQGASSGGSSGGGGSDGGRTAQPR
jgi:hypothetical protein